MYAFIESSTGIVWATSTGDFTVQQIVDTGLPVNVKRDDATSVTVAKASGLDRYSIWNGSTYELVWVLAELKTAKNEAIDLKTQQIIYAGVPYDGRIFVLQLSDQSTWHGIFNAVAAGVATYPIKVMDKSDEPYYLNNPAEFYQMYFVGFSSVGQILESGRAIKAQVNACTTKEEIDAIVDPR